MTKVQGHRITYPNGTWYDQRNWKLQNLYILYIGFVLNIWIIKLNIYIVV